MNPKLLSILLVTTLFFNCGDSQRRNNEINQKSNVKFSEELMTLKDYFHIPGLQAMVLKDDQVVFEDYLGYADLESKRPVDSLTVFPMASITKIFSSIVLMELESEGN